MSEKTKSLNDVAWEALFRDYDILGQIERDGQFLIASAQIKKYREPRLMAKFDHTINLPQIFADNGLAILPVSRGDYVISHLKAYAPFTQPDRAVTRASLPAHLESLDPDGITSEAVAINCALASGMLADFLQEESLYPTVSGRMGSGQFSFGICNTRTGGLTDVQVNHAQIEIDAALEGIGTLSLLEAKRDLAADFLIRQLYYPFRVWQSRVAKPVRPVFLVYSNGIFYFYEYAFEEPGLYNSLTLVRQKNYSIEDTSISLPELLDVRDQIAAFVPEPAVSFPQADSFLRVINLCELLRARPLSADEVTEEYAFDVRQTNYYTDAARYLGLVEKSRDKRKPVYALSETGRRVMRMPYKRRQLAFCRHILEHRVFYETFACCKNGYIPDRGHIVAIMKQAGLYHIGSDNTFKRRASTVGGWIRWMLGLVSA